jgi:hypothetical protein
MKHDTIPITNGNNVKFTCPKCGYIRFVYYAVGKVRTKVLNKTSIRHKGGTKGLIVEVPLTNLWRSLFK